MKQYEITDQVPETGEYVCTSCGEITEFEGGDDFSHCDNCGYEENVGWISAFLDEEEGLEGEAVKREDGLEVDEEI